MNVGQLRRLERAETLARILADPPSTPDPVTFAELAVGGPLDDWQRRAIRSTAPRQIILACRQSGKSTTTALRALWVALHEPGSLCLITAAAHRQSIELFSKVVASYRACGRPVPADAEARSMLELENGSRVLALPGRTDATLRGFSAPRLVICDEAARQPDELLYGLRPMLATNPRSQLILLSTPWGRRGTFYETWENGDDWERVGPIRGEDCSRISTSFLEQERREMPPWVFAAEWDCAFTDNELNVFSSELVAAALDGDLAPMWPSAREVA